MERELDNIFSNHLDSIGRLNDDENIIKQEIINWAYRLILKKLI